MTSPDHEIYARELFKRGLGYPLWEPEPKKDYDDDGEYQIGDVQIGDVGYVHSGGFYRLFNAMKEADDEMNTRTRIGVPPEFEKFSLGNVPIMRADGAIPEGPVFSQSVRKIGAGVEAGA